MKIAVLIFWYGPWGSDVTYNFFLFYWMMYVTKRAFFFRYSGDILGHYTECLVLSLGICLVPLWSVHNISGLCFSGMTIQSWNHSKFPELTIHSNLENISLYFLYSTFFMRPSISYDVYYFLQYCALFNCYFYFI